jgi:4-amino-4-deoxy-L-arabinose transferase-like glycosyltransferase
MICGCKPGKLQPMSVTLPDPHKVNDSPQHPVTRWRGPLALVVILALGATLRLWHLDRAGFGTFYYAAGVLGMLGSWHNFLFNSFDPAGFVSVDKPPLALWLQAASARLLGFSGWSIHLPQAIEGVASIALLYHLIQRRFGQVAGLLAALFLALMPISVAVDRSNNTDSCLVLCLLVAAWALSVSAESSSRRGLLGSMALLGVAFNVKMLAAIVVLPAFAAAYFFGARLSLRRRLTDLTLGGAVLAVVSLLWCVTYDLTPPESRPYAGSTQTNSMLELVIGQNGMRRFVRTPRLVAETAQTTEVPADQTLIPPTTAAGTDSAELPPVSTPANAQSTPNARPANAQSAPNATPADAQSAPNATPQRDAVAATSGANRGIAAVTRNRAADRLPIGPLRLLHPLLADQAGWLYPLAALAVAFWILRRRLRPLLDPKPLLDSGPPLDPEPPIDSKPPYDHKDVALLLWSSWLLTYAAVLSFAGGIFHAYYLSAVAPPVCALSAVALVRLCDWYREGGRRVMVLPLSLLVVLAWELYVNHGFLTALLSTLGEGAAGPAGTAGAAGAANPAHLRLELLIAPLVFGILCVGVLLLGRTLRTLRSESAVALCSALAVSLSPATWAIGTLQSSGNGSSPAAQPPGVTQSPQIARGSVDDTRADPQLVSFLTQHYGGERFMLATLSAQQAAPIILATGKPVMAMGGFAGSDPILTPQTLEQFVQRKQLRFVLVGGAGGAALVRRGALVQEPLIEWVQQHGRVVQPSLWRSARANSGRSLRGGYNGRNRGGRRGTGTASQLFDLRPDDPAPPSDPADDPQASEAAEAAEASAWSGPAGTASP